MFRTWLSRLGAYGGKAALILSLSLVVSLAVCYRFQPDRFAIITFWPAWVWLPPGVLLLAAGWRRNRKRVLAVVAAFWFAFLIFSVEEFGSLLSVRSWPAAEWEEARRRGQGVRVVSANCGGGNIAAAEEVKDFHPDVVVLQETPIAGKLERLARELFGKEAGLVSGLDNAIIARGSISSSYKAESHFVQAGVRLPSGLEMEVISLRLMPPPLSLRLWSPRDWRDQTESREVHRRQLDKIRRRIDTLPHDTALLIGGDFNAPQGDGACSSLRPRLRDAFSLSGLGWGNTVSNDFPLLRFDQIWVSRRLRPMATVARRSVHSDHRFVICDLYFNRDR